MAFYEVRLPDDISYGATGGPEYLTDVVTLASAHEQRNAYWTSARRKYDVGYVRTQAQIDALAAFFHSMKGRLHSFRYKDYADFTVTTANGLLGGGVGTGLPAYQLVKRYSSYGNTTDRTISKPVSGSVVVYRNAAPVTVGVAAGNIAIDTTTGTVTFVPDAESAASSITPGATTTVVLASNPGTLVAGKKLHLSGFTGADAASVNGIAHTINSVSGAGPYTFVLATDTSGKTITLGTGTGKTFPQASDALTWAGEFDVPCRFDTDALTATLLGSGPGARMYQLGSVPIIEVRA